MSTRPSARIAWACASRATGGVPVVETYHTYFEEYVAHYLPWLPGGMLRFIARRLSAQPVQRGRAPDRADEGNDRGPAALRHRDTGRRPAHGHRPRRIPRRGRRGVPFARHGIAADQPVVATVSRMAIEKNIGFLIEVVQRLVRDFPGLRFVIAGEGPDATAPATEGGRGGLVRERAVPGNLDRRTTLLDCYRAADAFLFASPTENAGPGADRSAWPSACRSCRPR
jgi:glycosyltransferase involved in cell wall biosynthesis